MSIDTVQRITYEYTCEVCDALMKFTKKSMKKMIRHFEVIGTAKAAAQLYQQGYHAESKAVMLQLKELKKND
jgi:predicted DCC family thiol-disulfide oxidoreductase YuxK|tara:strand:- start:465 stop:680 length:216 start_codon:yes stop_codon:yes gene_type:complete